MIKLNLIQKLSPEEFFSSQKIKLPRISPKKFQKEAFISSPFTFTLLPDALNPVSFVFFIHPGFELGIFNQIPSFTLVAILQKSGLQVQCLTDQLMFIHNKL